MPSGHSSLSRVERLAARRAELLARSHAQREALAAATAELAASLGFAEKLFGFARRVRAHPVLAGAAVAALLFLKPVRVLRWLSNALTLLVAVRHVRQLLRDR